MIKVNLSIESLSWKYIEALPDKFKLGLSKSLVKAMLFAEAQAKAIFIEGGPVLPPPGPLVARTGHLRRSIRSGVKDGVGYIDSNVEYGAIHEIIGAGKKRALRPFLMPSFQNNNLDRIRNIIIDGVVEEMVK